ncbi:MAG: hypothetical protein ACREPR_13025 [Brasilonema sp.]
MVALFPPCCTSLEFSKLRITSNHTPTARNYVADAELINEDFLPSQWVGERVHIKWVLAREESQIETGKRLLSYP